MQFTDSLFILFYGLEMKESILHYVWQQKLFSIQHLSSTEGERLEVIDVGKFNTDAGPDFFNAKIKIGSTIWAGNIEIHQRSSDWFKHHHQADKSYDTVILHVVQKADTEIFRTDGEKIPQLELTFPQEIELNYKQLLEEKKWISCADKVGDIPSIFIQSWKTFLLTERLEHKMESIQHLLHENKQHWEEAFYIVLAQNFGFSTNALPFKNLAKSIPLSVLSKHKDQLLQLEALLFGQAGLLDENSTDVYLLQLKKEHLFLQSKYALQPLSEGQWKLLRLRPDNFPHIRIAQFAALIHSSSKLFSKILDCPDIAYLHSLFNAEPSGYWQNHYVFGIESPAKKKKIGAQSVNGIIINTVVPFVFCYAYQKNDQALKDKALQLLETLPVEHNSIVSGWESLGIHATSAFDSQALIQLKKCYCDDKKCLRCRIGHKVLTISQKSSLNN